MSSLVNKYKAFRKDQEGSATIEFVLLFPAFMALFFMGFESGYYMVRGVMLERAVDVAVRDVRLANGNVPELDQMKTNICNVAQILQPDCESSLQIEIRPVAPVPGGVAAAGSQVSCIDKRVDADDDANATTYNTGSGNQLMLVRVCALAQPMFPTTGIGAGMRYDAFGNYAIVATSAFVNEPSNSIEREEVPLPVSTGNGNGDAGRGNGSETGDPGASEAVNMGGDEGGAIAGGTTDPGTNNTGSINAGSTTGAANGGGNTGTSGGSTGGGGSAGTGEEEEESNP